MPQVKEYFHDVDIKANQLFNSRLHNITTTDRITLGGGLSTGDKGYQVYDIDLLTPFFWDGVNWNPAGGGTPVVPTLQEVTDAGFTTNNNIELISGGNLVMNAGAISFSTDLINSGLLYSEVLTTLRAWSLPDASGIIPLTVNGVAALTDGSITIPTGGPTPTLQQVLIAGSYVTDQSITSVNSSNGYSSTYYPDFIGFYNNSYAGLKADYIQIGNDTTNNQYNVLWAKENSLSGIWYKTLRPLYSVDQTNSTEYLLPDTNTGLTSITLVSRVNGNTPDDFGNVTIAVGTGTVTDVTATSPLSSTGGTTPDITIQQASGSQDGYLSSGDWSTFNGKQDVISLTTTGTSGAATFIANTLNIPDYGAGYTTPNLQQVTDVGNTTTNDILVQGSVNNFIKISKDISLTGLDNGMEFFYTDTLGYVQSYINNVNDNAGDYRQGYIYTAVNNVGTNDYISPSLIAISTGTETYASIGITKTSGGNNTGLGIEHGDTTIGSVLRYATSAGGGAGSYIKFDEDTISTYVYTGSVLSSVNKGLKLDFANNQYSLGNLSSDYIKVDDTLNQVTVSSLSGTGTEMVVADASGVLSRQAIPAAQSVGFEMNFLLMGA